MSDPEYLSTMGQIATICRQIVGGRDINGIEHESANVWNIGYLIAELQPLLDRYDRQMLEASRKVETALHDALPPAN